MRAGLVDRGTLATRIVAFALTLFSVQPARDLNVPPAELPASATQQLTQSLTEAKAHLKHVWRDTPPTNPDGSVNAYVEISRGDRRKWEYRMPRNARAIDRMMPASIGGYPVNYGYVPQTISWDGDPFDALVLGPPIEGGRLVSGVIVGLLFMEDEKGWDAKVVLSRTAPDGRQLHQLTKKDQDEMASFFSRYKLHEPGKFSKVPGWGSREGGLAHVTITHAFFLECRTVAKGPCRTRN